MNLENQVQAAFVRETYERTAPGSLFALIIALILMTFQLNSPELGTVFLYIGCAILVVLSGRATISILGLKGRISSFTYLPHLKAAIALNSFLWGIAFCLDAWYAKMDGVDRFISFSLMVGITGATPSALVTMPYIQRFLYITILLAPGVVYFYRIGIGEIPSSFLPLPISLVLFLFYNIVSGNKLLSMLTKNIENRLRLEHEQENLRKTLKQLKVAQDDLMNERARSINSERLSFLASMASGVAHEINNPLTISGGQIFRIQNLLSDEPSRENSKKIGAFVDKITEMNTKIRNIVRGLQYFSRERRIETPEVFSVGDLMELNSHFFDERMKSNKIEFNVQPFPDVAILGQKNELAQALYNLLENAIDAVQSVPHKVISISFKVIPNSLEISVSDNGQGVDAEIRDRVFDPFFTTKDVGQGTGLGLSVARGIVQSHGGTLRFTSVRGNTTFILTLPLAASGADPAPAGGGSIAPSNNGSTAA